MACHDEEVQPGKLSLCLETFWHLYAQTKAICFHFPRPLAAVECFSSTLKQRSICISPHNSSRSSFLLCFSSALFFVLTHWQICLLRAHDIEVIYKPRHYFVGLATHIMTITTSQGTVEDLQEKFQSNRKFIIMLSTSLALCTAAARRLLDSFTVTSRATWTEKIMFSL